MNGIQQPKVHVQDSFNNYLKINRETIKELFFEMNGHCVPLLRKIKESYDGSANLRGLQIFCKQFRKELKNRGESIPCRYETQPGDHLQIDFGEQDVMIGGSNIRIHFFVSVLGYSRRIYVKAFTAENTEAWLNGIENAFRQNVWLQYITAVSSNLMKGIRHSAIIGMLSLSHVRHINPALKVNVNVW